MPLQEMIFKPGIQKIMLRVAPGFTVDVGGDLQFKRYRARRKLLARCKHVLLSAGSMQRLTNIFNEGNL